MSVALDDVLRLSVVSSVFVVSVAREDAQAWIVVFWKIPINRGEKLTCTPTVKDRQWQK